MLSQETVTRNAGRACTRSLLPVQSAVDAAEQCLDEQICVESHACVQRAPQLSDERDCASAKERLKRDEPARARNSPAYGTVSTMSRTRWTLERASSTVSLSSRAQ